MDKEKKNLYGFGYGVSLLIPFFVTLYGIDHGLKWWMVFGLFFALLFIVSRMVPIKPLFNIWVLALQMYVFEFALQQGFGSLSFVFLGLSVVMILMTVIRVEWLRPAYAQFIRIAHFIGSVITGLALSIMFYVVFGIAGIILRLIRKDLLDKEIDKSVGSYWINREQVAFNKSDYTRQF